MLYLSENLKKYRVIKGFTQEDVAEYLGVTPQSVSKWERGECYPDITLLPALANIFETSIDLLVGMDVIRAEEARYSIHKTANEHMKKGDLRAAEKVYRDALLMYPNKPGMVLGLASVFALKGQHEEAVELMERGLEISVNEKQKSTIRAALCFLYLKCGEDEKAKALAGKLPHIRETREMIQPLIHQGMSNDEIDDNIRKIILGEDDELW